MQSRHIGKTAVRIRLAEAVHGTLPDILIFGIDMIREEGTGDFYLLACNPGGLSRQVAAEKRGGR